jgi:hypothetical protein
MGCDIHLYVEYKSDGMWHTLIRDPHCSRDYQLFTILAGVRGVDEPLVPLRGFPADHNFSDAAEDYFEADTTQPEPDWHSCTWLTVSELSNAISSCEDPVHVVYRAIEACARALACEYETRVVMWFDS